MRLIQNGYGVVVENTAGDRIELQPVEVGDLFTGVCGLASDLGMTGELLKEFDTDKLADEVKRQDPSYEESAYEWLTTEQLERELEKRKAVEA